MMNTQLSASRLPPSPIDYLDCFAGQKKLSSHDIQQQSALYQEQDLLNAQYQYQQQQQQQQYRQHNHHQLHQQQQRKMNDYDYDEHPQYYRQQPVPQQQDQHHQQQQSDMNLLLNQIGMYEPHQYYEETPYQHHQIGSMVAALTTSDLTNLPEFLDDISTPQPSASLATSALPQAQSSLSMQSELHPQSFELTEEEQRMQEFYFLQLMRERMEGMGNAVTSENLLQQQHHQQQHHNDQHHHHNSQHYDSNSLLSTQSSLSIQSGAGSLSGSSSFVVPPSSSPTLLPQDYLTQIENSAEAAAAAELYSVPYSHGFTTSESAALGGFSEMLQAPYNLPMQLSCSSLVSQSSQQSFPAHGRVASSQQSQKSQPQHEQQQPKLSEQSQTKPKVKGTRKGRAPRGALSKKQALDARPKASIQEEPQQQQQQQQQELSPQSESSSASVSPDSTSRTNFMASQVPAGQESSKASSPRHVPLTPTPSTTLQRGGCAPLSPQGSYLPLPSSTTSSMSSAELLAIPASAELYQHHNQIQSHNYNYNPHTHHHHQDHNHGSSSSSLSSSLSSFHCSSSSHSGSPRSSSNTISTLKKQARSMGSNPYPQATPGHREPAPRRYNCEVCNKKFTRPSTLRTHMNSHTGERPFACEMEGCGWRFTVLSNLKRHMRICQVKKPGEDGGVMGGPSCGVGVGADVNAVGMDGQYIGEEALGFGSDEKMAKDTGDALTQAVEAAKLALGMKVHPSFSEYAAAPVTSNV
jgi:hypothetical protein